MDVIRRAQYEHADRMAVQEAVASRVEQSPETFVALYRAHPEAHGGRYVGADLFKETFEEYAQSKEARNRYNSPVHNSAAVLAAALFAEVVSDRSDPQRDKAIFLTGSPGAGKTTTVMDQGALPVDVRVIYEGQMFDPATAAPKVQMALDAGAKPIIAAVQPRPETALENTFRRFDEVGRGASIQTMARIQGDLAGGLRELHSRFGSQIELRIFDYRDPEHRTARAGWDHLAVLESEGNRHDIESRLARHLQRHRDAGTITDACFRQAAGLAPSRGQLELRGVDAVGHEAHEHARQRPGAAINPSQARVLIGQVASLPDLAPAELARLHFLARQDASWAASYDQRHGPSVATRSRDLASAHGAVLAQALIGQNAARGGHTYPELRGHYAALHAAKEATHVLGHSSQERTLSALREKMAVDLKAGKLLEPQPKERVLDR